MMVFAISLGRPQHLQAGEALEGLPVVGLGTYLPRSAAFALAMPDEEFPVHGPTGPRLLGVGRRLQAVGSADSRAFSSSRSSAGRALSAA